MSRKLLRLSFLVTVGTSTALSLPLLHSSQMVPAMTVSVIRAHSQRTTVSTAAIVASKATHRRHTRRHHTPGLSAARATYRKGILYDALKTADAQERTPAEEGVKTSWSVEPRSFRLTNVNTGMIPSSTASILLGTPSASSDASLGPSLLPDLDMSQPGAISHPRLHPAIIPAFVGSAVGAVLLTALTLLVVCRRRTPARGRSNCGKGGLHGWFNSNRQDDVIFIRVPPPTMPLKGILIRNHSNPSISDDACSDRMSLTSSQMSMIINKLPKSYDSGLEEGVLDEVKVHGGCSPIKVATRIGPSQSDFITNLFGLDHADSFSSGTSSASRESTLPPNLSSHLPPQSPPRSQLATVPYSAYELPSLTLVNSPKPTFPPAVASPTLSHTSGPRGHGLVLTGDQGIPLSFAQWHHQRSMARDKGWK